MDPLRIFIGYDSKEPVAYHVLAQSILRRASCPVAFTPLVQDQLRAAKLYTRPRGPTESTEFSMTRFLVPCLCEYRGLAIFMDCDMLCQADVAELVALAHAQSNKPVLICPHEYTPRTDKKFLGQVQTSYPRKNWSSLMIFNLQHFGCRMLTVPYVNKASGLELHRFNWLDHQMIGKLPLEWNWLVGEYDPNPQAKLLHYTLGGPWFSETRDCDQADAWRQEYERLGRPAIKALAQGVKAGG